LVSAAENVAPGAFRPVANDAVNVDGRCDSGALPAAAARDPPGSNRAD